ncbi:OsmC family peroxiredoxin [Pseudoduganella sp. FT25W]|jgi:putative redox protein|uniref:OsmC family peroxiredoxin n=1 Tax=Duganella alba TaxID=2666081 RepID=A0A6L5QKN7_9BURK|nr:OsmC family protein [Duganella alba]MRX10270.1 OsmC family peroxiredoxin [Duganella alba]MRX18557.1 OsmC family peroxiredoxin [Duganella alba]
MTIKALRDQSLPMRHIVHVRNHIISADISAEEGGSDAGPSPHDLYDAALSACKGLTVVWYAKRKNIPLENVEVTMERDDSEERHGVYRLTATLHLTGELTDAQRTELLSVAEKCPVHKLMTSVTTEITTVLG